MNEEQQISYLVTCKNYYEEQITLHATSLIPLFSVEEWLISQLAGKTTQVKIISVAIVSGEEALPHYQRNMHKVKTNLGTFWSDPNGDKIGIKHTFIPHVGETVEAYFNRSEGLNRISHIIDIDSKKALKGDDPDKLF